MASPYVVHHFGTEHFARPPDEMWAEITDVERFEEWWRWLADLELVRGGIVTGGGLRFSIVSPLPHRLHLIVDIEEVKTQEVIVATVTGDLRGDARLAMRPAADGGTDLDLEWDLEPTQSPVRLLVRIARPLILWTKDWAIDIALDAFRRRVGA